MKRHRAEIEKRTVGRLGLAALAVVLVALTAAAPRDASENVDAFVNGREVVFARRGTVADALRAAYVTPHDGVLRAIDTHAPLDPHWHPAQYVRNGRFVTAAARLRTGDRLWVVDGADEIEATTERDAPMAPASRGGLPDVERELWLPPTDGLVRQTVGAHSGHLVSQVTVQQPIGAVRMQGQVIALTFDDGPDPTFTPQVLQVLASAGIKATFCVIGREARRYPDLLKTIAAQGHGVCDHTESHPHLNRISADRIAAQLASPAQFIKDTLGQGPAFVRAPWGDVNGDVINIAHQDGLRVLGWTIDTSDYLKPAPEVLVNRVVSNARPGRIVLMHDGGGDRSHTVAALPVIIAQLQAQGYKFVVPTASAAAV